MRILLAEDEPLIARFIARGLQAEGYHTTVAGDGDVAVARLTAQEWDLLILDLMLPDRDGFWVLEQALRLHPRLPVLVLSARTATDTKVRALNAGASDYLAKPFALDELLARVKARLRESPPELPAAGNGDRLSAYGSPEAGCSASATAGACISRGASSSCWSISCGRRTSRCHGSGS